ncbi:MAG: hypothetical protein JXJ04_15490, partial [Spirochaetales bacterium]|nr:hypothetical protein [Spirochaetales bacterium]
MKNIRIILFLILSFSLFIFLSCYGDERPAVKNGFIDISDWSFEENGSIELKGEWKFVFNDDNIAFAGIDYNDFDWDLFNVPEHWNSKTGKSFGYCWLRLKIRNNKNERLGLYLLNANSAYILFINNVLAMKNGISGNTRIESVPQNIPEYIELPNTEYIFISWKISNFNDVNGGPRFSPIINTIEK